MRPPTHACWLAFTLAPALLLVAVPSIATAGPDPAQPASALSAEVAPAAAPAPAPGVAPAPAAAAPDDEDCLGCHGDEEIEPVSAGHTAAALFVNRASLTGSVHEEVGCTHCHQVHDEETGHYEEGGTPPSLACIECHEDAVHSYEEICIHGVERAKGNDKAPWCHDCHGDHQIVPLESEGSILSHKNQPGTCGKCHGGDEPMGEGHITKRRLVDRYYTSVHWQSVKEGKPAATCADCHGTHCVLPSSETKSSVTRVGLLTTCAQCHPAEVQVYSKGAHGRTLLHGNLDVPTCTTCHGDHDMTSLKTQAGGTRDFSATQVCIWCHGNERMMARYALDTSPVESYMRDYHGLTQRGSLGTSATCADCHDPHHSLPSSHPESRMHISNRGSACGKCHGKVSESFIMSFTHRSMARELSGGKVKQVVTWIYIVLIVVVIGGMLLHNLVIWVYFVRRKQRYQRAHAVVERLNKTERLWHWLLLISFGVLVLTGFALSFSESALFGWLYSAGMTEPIRAWLHRIGAVLMIVDMLMLIAFALKREGRAKWWRAMWPRLSDLRDFFVTMRYYLRRSSEAPRYPVFNYAEKAEYWALWWGCVVMALTGFVMWFSGSLPESSPVWLIEVAHTIHYYEAILATLAIIVWHFFHTVFMPGEYPMNTAWLTGVLSEHEAHERFTAEAIEAQRPRHDESEPEAEEPPPWMQDS